MISFKEFVGEMYVIGHRQTYDDNIEQSKANIEAGNSQMPASKMGLEANPSIKYDKGFKRGKIHPNEAGAAFKTHSDAKNAIKNHWNAKDQKNMSVYKVKGKFGKDTVYHNPETGFHHLKQDAEILRRVD